MGRARTGTYFFVVLAGMIAGEYLLFVNGGFIFGILFAIALLQSIK